MSQETDSTQGASDEALRETPPLSVVIATVDPWPAIENAFNSVLDQASELGAEIVLADGHGDGVPDRVLVGNVVRVRAPGTSIFQARAHGMSAARGDIVAVTEDHCRAAPDWCRRVLECFEEHPGVSVLGGAVENAATATLLDHMHFLFANGHSMRPLGTGGPRSMSGQANVSYRRAQVQTVDPDRGVLQMQLNRDLGRAGVVMRLDERPLTWHDQPLDLPGVVAMHFHNGRCIAGFRNPRLSPAWRVMRVLSTLVLPAFLTARAVLTAWRKRRMRLRAAAGLPWLALMGCSHGAGELVGYLTGPGDSPARMR